MPTLVQLSQFVVSLKSDKVKDLSTRNLLKRNPRKNWEGNGYETQKEEKIIIDYS
jgi:hypothetical protein